MTTKMQKAAASRAARRARGIDPWSDEGIAERFRKLWRSPLVQKAGRWFTVKSLRQDPIGAPEAPQPRQRASRKGKA